MCENAGSTEGELAADAEIAVGANEIITDEATATQNCRVRIDTHRADRRAVLPQGCRDKCLNRGSSERYTQDQRLAGRP
jgi:hypothetical protein